jgi:hypothetical protein
VKPLFFVKDVIGPKGISFYCCKRSGRQRQIRFGRITYLKRNRSGFHHADIDANNAFTKADEWINLQDEPDHQELCNREQSYFLKAINENIDLTDHIEDAVNSLRIAFACDESVRTGNVVKL